MDSTSAPKARNPQRRKSDILPPSKAEEMQSEFRDEPVNNHVSKTHRRSVNSPPTWQNRAREETNTPSSLYVSDVPRKYSENLYTQRRSYALNARDGNAEIQHGRRGFRSRRSMSLVHKGPNGMLPEEEVLLRDGELRNDHEPSIAASFSVKHNLDDITWSRYWHDARNRTYIRERLLSNETISQRKEFRGEKLISNEPDSNNNNNNKLKNGESKNGGKDLSDHVTQLSLEERLEKIERDSGLAGPTKRNVLIHKTSSIN